MPITKVTQNVISPNIVTTNTDQEITGNKTFTKNTFVNGVSYGSGQGQTCVAIGGSDCLSQNITGTSNLGIGFFGTLASNLEGNHNVAVGDFAMLYNQRGSGNVALGINALNALGFNGDDNEFPNNNNVAIGYNSGPYVKSGSNNIYIGEYSGDAGLPYEDNKMYIGSIESNIFARLHGELYVDNTFYNNQIDPVNINILDSDPIYLTAEYVRSKIITLYNQSITATVIIPASTEFDLAFPNFPDNSSFNITFINTGIPNNNVILSSNDGVNIVGNSIINSDSSATFILRKKLLGEFSEYFLYRT